MGEKSFESDTEALWFPAHLSAGDSFSRPTTADGGAMAEAAPEPADVAPDYGFTLHSNADPAPETVAEDRVETAVPETVGSTNLPVLYDFSKLDLGITGASFTETHASGVPAADVRTEDTASDDSGETSADMDEVPQPEVANVVDVSTFNDAPATQANFTDTHAIENETQDEPPAAEASVSDPASAGSIDDAVVEVPLASVLSSQTGSVNDDVGMPGRRSRFAFSQDRLDNEITAAAPDSEDDLIGGSSGGGDDVGLPGRGFGGPRPPRKGGIKPSSWLWLTLWGAAAVGIVGYAARKDIAAEMVQSWLHGQGVPAKLSFDKLGFSHASGHITLGDASAPDLDIGHFDVDYNFNPFAGGGQPMARLKAAHLTHPVLAVSLKGGKLNFGSLDKLVQNALSAPPSNEAPPQDIVIDDAVIRLQTDYGLIRAHGGMSLHDGHLDDANLSVPAEHLSGPMGEGDFNGGTLTARAMHDTQNGDQLQIKARFGAESWDIRNTQLSAVESADADHQNLHMQGLDLDVEARVPYSRTQTSMAALAGALHANIAAKAQGVQSQAADISGLEANIGLDGELKSDGKALKYEGGLRLLSRADTLQSGNIDSKDVKLDGPGLGLRAAWSGDNGLAVAVGGAMSGDIGLLRQDDLFFKGAHVHLDRLALTSDAAGSDAQFQGAVTLQHTTLGELGLDGTVLTLNGHSHSDATSHQWSVTAKSDITGGSGHYTGLHALAQSQTRTATDNKTPSAPVDAPTDSIVALDRGFSRFSPQAKGLNVTVKGDNSASPPRFDVRLQGVAEADLNGGGKIVLSPLAKTPLLASQGQGGFGLAVGGGDLPQVRLDIDSLGYRDPRNPFVLSGGYKLSSQFTLDPVAAAKLDARGHFTTTGSGVLVTLDGPAAFSARSAELGDHLEALSATLDQAGGALFRSDGGSWKVTGVYKDLALTAPEEKVALKGGQGMLNVFSIASSDTVGVNATLKDAVVGDVSPLDEKRFNALALSGTLTQDAKAMTGRFTAVTPNAKTAKGEPLPIAAINLDNDMKTQKGSLSFKTLDLTFVPGGLQPVDLSPAVATVMRSGVTGKASFDGAFDWDKQTTKSSGVLKIDGLNFTGAAGASENMKGEIDFTSLSPLLSDPRQMISIDRMDVGLPLEHLSLALQFQGDHVDVQQADVQSPGGRVSLEPMSVSLDGSQPVSGVVSFNGLDFGKIIEATDLSKNMSFKGQLSGRLPFTITDAHISFAHGEMGSDQPGEISVKRQAIADVTASGALTDADGPKAGAKVKGDPSFNAVSDLAFQAMEYIHYDRIDATVDSKDGGVLDTTFHIKGHFEPPQPQKATISLGDYVSGKWINKPIKLPSGTPVELYLDVPINLDGILSDLAAFHAEPAKVPAAP